MRPPLIVIRKTDTHIMNTFSVRMELYTAKQTKINTETTLNMHCRSWSLSEKPKQPFYINIFQLIIFPNFACRKFARIHYACSFSNTYNGVVCSTVSLFRCAGYFV